MPAPQAQLDELQATNARFNAIPYEALPKIAEPADLWRDHPDPGETWVCRDYVLAKRKALLTAGWPAPLLTVVTCYTEPVMPPTDPADPTSGREYHAVLAVKCGGDIYILDSRTVDIGDVVYLWTDPPFAYLWWLQQLPGSILARDASPNGNPPGLV